VYGFLWVLARAVARLCFRYRVIGSVPRDGGFLVAANHASYFDIPLLGCGMPRRAWYLGRSDLFPVPGLNGILQWLGWIPLRLGRLDRKAFDKSIALIKQGNVVVIFPEGSRSLDGQLGEAKPGLGMIVAQTGCPVVPAYLKGTFEVLPSEAKWPRFHPVTVRFGEPVTFPRMGSDGENKKFYQEVSQTVMERIAALGKAEPSSHRATASTHKAE
jgi:1-acyl-sn-glycerol-3-phosphate acyltransferase